MRLMSQAIEDHRDASAFVERLFTSTPRHAGKASRAAIAPSSEVAAWNAEVDRRKAEKAARKAAARHQVANR